MPRTEHVWRLWKVPTRTQLDSSCFRKANHIESYVSTTKKFNNEITIYATLPESPGKDGNEADVELEIELAGRYRCYQG